MIATLTSEQLQAIAAAPDRPARLLDPNTNKTYVLLSADAYEKVKALLEDDFDLRDAYRAQFRSALRAGWDEPAMDDYNNYDENFKKR